MGEAEANEASAWEILVVDREPAVVKGLEALFRQDGLIVTGVSDPVRARDQITNRFFHVALVDLDTPQPLGGLDLVRLVNEKSPLTSVIVMTSRKAFDAVAPAFRAGANDVVLKTQDSVPYLRERVLTATREMKAEAKREKLLVEVGEVHEAFLHQMMDLQRQITDLEDKLLRRDDESSTTSVPHIINLLVVDDEPGLPTLLQRDLTKEKGWKVKTAQSGGEALDAATQLQPHVLVLKDVLPDLPVTMVVKTVKASSPDVVALVFTPPSEEGVGEIKMMDQSRLITLVSSFSDPGQLVGALSEVREALRKKSRERRYLSVFRKQHFQFLKRYNLIKQKIGQKP